MARSYISPLAHAVHFGFVRIRLRSGCKLLRFVRKRSVVRSVSAKSHGDT